MVERELYRVPAASRNRRVRPPRGRSFRDRLGGCLGRPVHLTREARPVATYDRKDHFHRRAKREGFRSRAVYKLAELQQAHRILRPGQRVVDLGCWPGGWLQEASRVVGGRGRVVGVDLAAIEPPLEAPNVVSLVGDIEDTSICERIREELGGPCDVLLSDAAPKLTGIRERDRAQEERLLEAVEALIPGVLRPGGDLLVKLLECPEAQQFQRRLAGVFDKTKTVKAKATRKGSSERYLLARGFRGDGDDPERPEAGEPERIG